MTCPFLSNVCSFLPNSGPDGRNVVRHSTPRPARFLPSQGLKKLVWCLPIGWCFVAPKMALGEARGGSIAPRLCDRGATKPKAILGATLRAAVLFASRVVARSLQTHGGYARRSRLAGGKNPSRRNTSQLGDTTLAVVGVRRTRFASKRDMHWKFYRNLSAVIGLVGFILRPSLGFAEQHSPGISNPGVLWTGPKVVIVAGFLTILIVAGLAWVLSWQRHPASDRVHQGRKKPSLHTARSSAKLYLYKRFRRSVRID